MLESLTTHLEPSPLSVLGHRPPASVRFCSEPWVILLPLPRPACLSALSDPTRHSPLIFFHPDQPIPNINSDLNLLRTSISCLLPWKLSCPISQNSYSSTCLTLLPRCELQRVGASPTHSIMAASGTVSLAHSKEVLNIEWIKFTRS